MYESLTHSFCREHSNRNSVSSCVNKYIFSYSCNLLVFVLFCFVLVRWDFAFTSFVGSGDFSSSIMVRAWTSVQNIGLPLCKWLQNFPLSYNATLVLIPLLPHVVEEIRNMSWLCFLPLIMMCSRRYRMNYSTGLVSAVRHERCLLRFVKLWK